MRLKSLGWKKGYRDEDTGAWYSDKPLTVGKTALIVAFICSMLSTIFTLVALVALVIKF